MRTIDLEERRIVTPQMHMDIIDAMIADDINRAVNSMPAHIVRSSEEATEAIRRAYAGIYVPNQTRAGVA